MAVQKNFDKFYEAAEKRRIAKELGIDENDLSLRPSKQDLDIMPSPAQRNIRNTRL